MYSINVFLTFSLSMFGMARMTFQRRRDTPGWMSKLALFGVGFLLCVAILVITVLEKFREGGWLTLLMTGAVVGLCFLIQRHYRFVRLRLAHLYRGVRDIDAGANAPIPITNPNAPTASTYRFSIGTDAIDEAEKLCGQLMREFPRTTFFGGKVVFARERWFQRFLHNESATAIQRRLYWRGATMVILPAKVSEADRVAA